MGLVRAFTKYGPSGARRSFRRGGDAPLRRGGRTENFQRVEDRKETSAGLHIGTGDSIVEPVGTITA
ncbi:hypothetical protein OJAV_G00234690 [Oryzias javanicus]|uniref:Uncharacterized protein n=1 Tax=Oryzias javanicus TaxID=123683 RepID=A0A3S2LX14_ORYJA|nr:hypothetical protein OJAV_G00234690 [Oryzias javanicus]